MKTLLIFGSNGMVGTSFPNKHKNIRIIKYGKKEINIKETDKVEAILKTINPDYVLNLAAYTNVLKAEENMEECFSVNTAAATKLAELCSKQNIHYIAVSTCGIFFNSYDSFDEDCREFNTTGIYYLSKLQLEYNLFMFCKDYTIIRPNWMFGSKLDHKFMGRTIKALLMNNDIEIANDVSGSYTYTKDFANKILELIENDDIKQHKLLHMVNSGCVTRYDSAMEIKKLVNSDSNIIPVENKKFQPNLRVAGKCNAQSKYIQLRSWQEAFKDFVESE